MVSEKSRFKVWLWVVGLVVGLGFFSVLGCLGGGSVESLVWLLWVGFFVCWLSFFVCWLLCCFGSWGAKRHTLILLIYFLEVAAVCLIT